MIKRLASTIYWIAATAAIGLGLLSAGSIGRPFPLLPAMLIGILFAAICLTAVWILIGRSARAVIER